MCVLLTCVMCTDLLTFSRHTMLHVWFVGVSPGGGCRLVYSAHSLLLIFSHQLTSIQLWGVRCLTADTWANVWFHDLQLYLFLMRHEGLRANKASLRDTAVSKRLPSNFSSGSVGLSASVVIAQGAKLFQRLGLPCKTREGWEFPLTPFNCNSWCDAYKATVKKPEIV